jgi:hypothetical protein
MHKLPRQLVAGQRFAEIYLWTSRKNSGVADLPGKLIPALPTSTTPLALTAGCLQRM